MYTYIITSFNNVKTIFNDNSLDAPYTQTLLNLAFILKRERHKEGQREQRETVRDRERERG